VNIIEAAKAMKKGKKVQIDGGFRFFSIGETIYASELNAKPAYLYLRDLLSDKWEVVDEEVTA
jgi:hypothetical protein